jgi:ATP-binding cassette subfamily B (MDR/TAP) protein 1
MTDGLDTIVGIKGNKLSAGQRQRIEIARAILNKPKILILDEATSALDRKSEKIIDKALDNISKMNITTITIAHRFLTIKNADLIYVLKDGKVYEQGTHDELCKKGGYYCDIIRTKLIRDELDSQRREEKMHRTETNIERKNTKTEVFFGSKIKEIAKSPSEIHLSFITLIKDLLINYKVNFILATLTAIAFGVFPSFNGYIKGKCTKSLNSSYETKRYDDSRKYSIIYIILVIGESIINFLENWLFYRLGIKLAKFYRNQLMKKYLSFHLSFYDLERNSPGTILTNMSLNTVQMKKIISDTIGAYIISISITITCLIIGCAYEYRLTLIAIVFLPFLIFINFIRKCSLPGDKRRAQKTIEAGTLISESLINTKTIFAYNFQRKAIKLYLAANDYLFRRQVLNQFLNGLIVGITLFSNFAKNAALFAATKRYVLNDSMDSDELTVIQSLLNSGFSKIALLMRDLGNIKKGDNAVKSFYSVFQTESLIPHYEEDNTNKLSPNSIHGKIELKHVYFAYPLTPDNIALKDINMTIMPGQKVAFVGYSGSGKSTIIKLLNRFYDVEDGKGEVLIDDVNIKDYNLYQLRKKIGFVSTAPSVFKTSTLENIRYGNLNATDEECIEAAKKTDILELIEREQVDESSEEKAKKHYGYSGGEKQKISVTRIILKDPTILLLDGVTASLDKESEIEILRALDELSQNKTTIIITHLFNVIKNCDKIFVFDKGRIVEQGTHEELMELKKRYYTIYNYSNAS